MGRESQSKQLKRWIIKGRFQLTTPMHLGTGLAEKINEKNWTDVITADHHGNPYIPGSSLKGVLVALAKRTQCFENLKSLFGASIDESSDNSQKTADEQKPNTIAGQAEFYNAYFAGTPSETDEKDQSGKNNASERITKVVPHVAIDRITGTAVDKKLFHSRSVNPGTCFTCRIIIQHADKEQIQQFLGLLEYAEDAPSFSLGGGANQSLGKIKWQENQSQKFSVRYFGKDQIKKWYQHVLNGNNHNWQDFAELRKDIKPEFITSQKNITVTLKLPLTLDFHTPFLVKAGEKKDDAQNEADAKPLTNHQGQVILPASSLRGRLRAQAEKILRTMCPDQDIPQGHEAPPYDGNAHNDLIGLLFGTSGWKGIVRTTDLIHCVTEYELKFDGEREAINDLSEEVKSCIIVDLVKTVSTAAEKPEERLHIRIIDSAGSLIVHKSEDSNWANDTFNDTSAKDKFKARLKEIDDPKNLDDTLREDIKKHAIQLATQTRHEMVAIDRFTGGGKEGAKFNVDYVECPTLIGKIYLDLHRLKASKLRDSKDKLVPALKPALGLISLLLRDLAEGDIPFGFGVNKGYGQCRAHSVMSDWTQRLDKIEKDLTVNHTLDALRNYLGNPVSHSLPPFETDDAAIDNSPATIEQSTGDTGLAFHNPYHFIPLNKPVIDNWPEAKPETLKADRQGHDQYHTDKFSGRIVCRLTTKTPLFIGAQTKSFTNNRKPSEAKPFKLNGKHAIPATSLRGMLSSLFESISNSNFRVLHPEKYSMRKNHRKGLSAMGRIKFENNKPVLQPLTLPTLFKRKQYKIPENWRHVFKNLTPLKVYFHSTDRSFSYNELYYMDLHNIKLSKKTEEITNDPDLRFPSKDENKDCLIGQRYRNKKIHVQKQNDLTSGWIRTLIDPCRELPKDVQHHVFLPDTTGQLDPLEIPDGVIARFEILADQALESMHLKENDKLKSINSILPYTPIGRNNDANFQMRVGKDTTCYKTRLKEGDIVFFDINKDGKITEISFSSIWRQGIERNGEFLTSADLLAKHCIHLLPFGMSNRCKNLSPVEQLFGVVEDRESKKSDKTDNLSKDDQAFGYTGKARIGFGTTDPATIISTESPITLKELSSPKPPSPALYLKPKNSDGYLSKTDVASQGNTTTLRGRKYYLHALRQNGDVAKLTENGQIQNDGCLPWKSKYDSQNDDGNKRRVRIEPIKKGNYFYFEIDFNNLDATELAQLCATLQPTPEFEHRLGMGKPLGLGSVKIEPLGLFLINRHQRYTTDGTNCDRYHRFWLKGGNVDQDWPEYLRQNVVTVNCSQAFNHTFDKLVQKGLAGTDADIKRALQLLGDPQYIGVPVHYPIARNGTLENKHFEWFGKNDKQNKNPLESIVAGTNKIPTLNKN